MKQALFARFCALAYEKAGIALKEGKEALVEARVGQRQRALGLEPVEAYLEYLENDESGEELVLFLDAISTNFTSFFREAEHFDLLRDLVREKVAGGQSRFRIWSAASSSGEEPYSIAISVLDAVGGRPVELKILATDISTRMLTQARNGVYEIERLEPLSAGERGRYLVPVPGEDPARVLQVRPEVRKLVTFARLNLARPPFPMSGPFDVIFCRNVMIYFDRRVRQGLINEAERLLRPGGVLMISHTETLTGIESGLKTISASIYSRESGANDKAWFPGQRNGVPRDGRQRRAVGE